MVKRLCFQTAYLSLLYGCEVVDKNIEEIISLSKFMIVCVCIYIYMYMHVYLLVLPFYQIMNAITILFYELCFKPPI